MPNTLKSNDNGLTIDLDRGKREYDINNVRYAVASHFLQATYSEEDRTLRNAIEEIISSEFVDLTHK